MALGVSTSMAEGLIQPIIQRRTNHPDEPAPKYLAKLLSSLILQSRGILAVFPKLQVYNKITC